MHASGRLYLAAAPGREVKVNRTSRGLDGALLNAFEHDPVVLVERFSEGMEIECSVLGYREPIASQPGEIVVKTGTSPFFSA